MSSNSFNHDVAGSDGEQDAAVVDGAPQAPVNPLLQVHALLRGRYWIAAILAVVGIVAGGAIGYRLQKPMYTSTGMIRVKPYLTPVMGNNNDQSGAMPYFDQFVGSQVALIRSTRVINHAMQQPDWKALNLGVGPEQVQGFMDSVDARNPPGTLFVLVSFTDPDPDVARRGAKSTIEAQIDILENKYDAVKKDVDTVKDKSDAELNTMKQSFEASLRELEKSYNELAAKVG